LADGKIESILEQFTKHVTDDIALQKSQTETLLNQLTSVWGEATERFTSVCPNFQQQYLKRSK